MILIPFVYFYFKVVIQNFSKKIKKSIFSIFFSGVENTNIGVFLPKLKEKLVLFHPLKISDKIYPLSLFSGSFCLVLYHKTALRYSMTYRHRQCTCT